MTHEKGRSMVEMQGVLAVIAVLTITAVAGYRYAMDKYRANTILNEVNTQAVDVAAQYMRSELPN